MVMKPCEAAETVGGYLKDDSEVHHDEGCTEHEILLLYPGLIQQRRQTVSDGPSQPTIAHNHLVYEL